MRYILSVGMMDSSPKATYLLRLSALLQENPSPEQVRSLLRQAQADGVKPNGLYLSAMRLHPKDLPLPPDPRLVLEGGASLPGPSATPSLRLVQGGLAGQYPLMEERWLGLSARRRAAARWKRRS